MPTDLRDTLQTTLGDGYTIERELTGGGMSRVFVADEAQLGRKIVVKVIPGETAAAVSIERFKREIQVAARLQHPHIVPVLSAGETNGLPFYTMPFVRGESLRARISKGGELPVNEAMRYLRDVAGALAYAHGEGVVHRDIKPDNVIVSGGVAVVTDFGVSKAMDVASTQDHVPTGITSLGVALGTPAYMSPEQASADPHVDHRADIYSFGCLAYELLCGTSPFGGRAPQQMLAAHVTEQPEPVLKRRPNLPPALAALVMKCLEKRAGDRPQSAMEVLTVLDAIGTPSGGTAPTAERLRAVPLGSTRWLGIGSAAIAIAAVAFIIWGRTHQEKPISIGATIPVAIGPDLEIDPAISPDGKVVAYVSETASGERIFVKQIDGGRAVQLTTETEGAQAFPRWSPDGLRVSFWSAGALYIIPALTGGSPKRAIEGARSHSWSRDGKQILYDNGFGIWIHNLSGGNDVKVVDDVGAHSPALSPDGRYVAYAIGSIPSMENLSGNSIWTTPVSGGERHRISDSTHVNVSPVWTPDGRSLLYVSNIGGTRDVYQQPIGSDGRASGAPIRITTALSSFWISLSADGSRMTYDAVRNFSNIYVVPIGSGPTTIAAGKQLTRDNQHIETIELSPSGKWLSYDSDREGNFDIYKLRVDGGDPVPLTTNSANDFAPTWSPDESTLAFHTTRNGTRDIYTVSAEGTDERQVTSGPGEDYFPAWSPDGKRLAFSRHEGRGYQYILLERKSDNAWGPPKVIATALRAPSSEVIWSPDGSLLAYLSGNEVRLVAPDGTGDRTFAEKTQLNGTPQGIGWSQDGKTVYIYAGPTNGRGTIWAVGLNGGAPRAVLTPEGNLRFGRGLFATDGSRIFYSRAAWESDVWVMDLKR